MREVIKTRNLKKTYFIGSVKVDAVKGVDISVKDGELVSIMGPSGSGKSTLMHLLGCLDTPTEGKYYLDGKDVSGLSENELADIRNRKIGFVFQTFNLLPHLNVMENVLLPVIYNPEGNLKEAEKMAVSLLSEMGLGGRLKHMPAQLSGGERQRVAIARALINNPVILFADEPTGNLDTKTGLDIIRILARLNKTRKVTEIIVTHDPSITKFTHRIIFIRDGIIEGEKINVSPVDPTEVAEL